MNYRIFLKTVFILFFLLDKAFLSAVELILSDDEYIEKAVFHGHMNAVSSVAFSLDGKNLALGLSNGRVELWDTEEKKIKSQFMSGLGCIWPLIFSPDGSLMLLKSLSGNVKLYDVLGHEIKSCFSEYYPKQTSSVAFSPDGRLIAGGFLDGKVRLYNVAGNKFVQEICVPGGVITSLAFSPSGVSVVIGCSNGVIVLWDIEKNLEYRLPVYAWCISSVAFSPDGMLIAVDYFDGKIRLWNIEVKEFVREFGASAGDVVKATSIAFSPGGRLIASGYSNGIVKLWDIIENKYIHEFHDHHDAITFIAFSPDGTRLAAAGGILIMWTDKLAMNAMQKLRETDKNSLLTLANCTHPRLGAESPAQILYPDLLHWISEFFIITPWKEVFEK
ncbi:MAG: WD40 repeat domain-containing protein [bacterium]